MLSALFADAENSAVRVEMPLNKSIELQNVQHAYKLHFVADFECATTPVASYTPSTGNSFTHVWHFAILLHTQKEYINL